MLIFLSGIIRTGSMGIISAYLKVAPQMRKHKGINNLTNDNEINQLSFLSVEVRTPIFLPLFVLPQCDIFYGDFPSRL